MNNEQLRAEFEAALGRGKTYTERDYQMYLLGRRAALQSQPTKAFPCRIVEADFETGTVTLEMQGKYAVSSGQKYLCDAPLQSQDREYALEAENVKLRDALEMMVEMVEMNGFGRDYAMDVARAALAQKQEEKHDYRNNTNG